MLRSSRTREAKDDILHLLTDTKSILLHHSRILHSHIPAVPEFLKDIDIENGVVVFSVIEGLLSINDK